MVVAGVVGVDVPCHALSLVLSFSESPLDVMNNKGGSLKEGREGRSTLVVVVWFVCK